MKFRSLSLPCALLILLLCLFLPSVTIALERDLCNEAEIRARDKEKAALTELLELYQQSDRRAEQECIVENLAELDVLSAEKEFIEQLQSNDHDTVLQAVFALQILGGDASVKPLHQALASADARLKCHIANALAGIEDERSVPYLAALAEDEDPLVRSCALWSLSQYRDPGFCQDFFEIWLTDRDKMVRKRAGMSFIENDCNTHVERSGKYAMDAKSCGYTQFFINTVKDAIADAAEKDEWKKVLKKLKIKQIIVDKDTPEEIIQVRLNLVFMVLDWGESVSVIHTFSNQGSVEKNKTGNLYAIENYSLKEEYVKQFCPIINFPDFAFWNDVIMHKPEKP